MATNMIVISLRIPKALVEEMKYLKEEYNINPSALMRQLIEDGLVKITKKLEATHIKNAQKK